MLISEDNIEAVPYCIASSSLNQVTLIHLHWKNCIVFFICRSSVICSEFLWRKHGKSTYKAISALILP